MFLRETGAAAATRAGPRFDLEYMGLTNDCDGHMACFEA